MQWNGTDNFGNLVMAESEARSMDQLATDLSDMINVVFHRHPEDVTFSIDLDFGQISAPSGLNVTHIMNVPWLTERAESGEDGAMVQGEVEGCLRECLSQADREASIQGPWED